MNLNTFFSASKTSAINTMHPSPHTLIPSLQAHNLIQHTWIEKDDKLETDVLGDVKFEFNEFAEDVVETVGKLSGSQQCQGQQVELLTIWQRGLVLEGKARELVDGGVGLEEGKMMVRWRQ